jgi:uncharacterized protein (DUF488 family)
MKGEAVGTVQSHVICGKRVYSMGTSTRSLDEFISLLTHYGIETVADVRSFPTSRFEHFRRDRLERALKERGFCYVYLGAELGGYRRGGYEKYMNTPDYGEGLAKLEEIGSSSVTAFVCAERLPWKCHRRWIGESLMREGWEVIHIVDERRTWRPGSFAQERMGKGHSVLGG